MVIVDVRAHGGRGDTGIPTDAYFAVEEIRDDGTATQRTFTHVPTSIEAEEAEEIGVEHLLRDISSSSAAASSSLLTTQSLSNRVSAQLDSLRGLHARLKEISEYLNDVRKGKMPVNHQIIYQVQEIVGLLPQLGGDVDLGKAFRVQVNDQNVMVYLGLLIRTVQALHDLSKCLECPLLEEGSKLTNSRQPHRERTAGDRRLQVGRGEEDGGRRRGRRRQGRGREARQAGERRRQGRQGRQAVDR